MELTGHIPAVSEQAALFLLSIALGLPAGILLDAMRLLRVLDYISAMTDGYAVNLYQKLKGISL